MIWSMVDDAYEVTLASSLEQVADYSMDGSASRYIEVSGSSLRVEVRSVNELKKLLRGKERFYVYPEEDGNGWVYKCQRQS